MTDDLNNEHSATEETPESGGVGDPESGSNDGDGATGVTDVENVPEAVGEPSQEPDSPQDSGTEEGSSEEGSGEEGSGEEEEQDTAFESA